MARNFPNFLEAYFEYAQDAFCPDEFHRWIGLSILSGAIERKISLQDGKVHHIPNIFVMLVSHPAIGKSTAIERGTNLLEEMKIKYNPEFRIIPNQATEPALIDLMKIVNSTHIPGTSIYIPHSSGYFYASEASASALQNTCGDFVAALTAFYDCPAHFRKKLKSDHEPVEIENSCMSILAGSTFDYLKNLVNENSVMGGFASRNIYVVHKERKVRVKKWGGTDEIDKKTQQKLVEDLSHINKLVGPMRVDPSFINKVEKWFPEFDAFLHKLDSPKLESLFSRKGTNLIKVSMLLSIAESDSLIVTGEHFDRAKKIMDDVTKDLPMILSSAITANTETQGALNLLILQTVKKYKGRMPLFELKQVVGKNGNDLSRFDTTLNFMCTAKNISLDFQGSDAYVNLLVDPNTYL